MDPKRGGHLNDGEKYGDLSQNSGQEIGNRLGSNSNSRNFMNIARYFGVGILMAFSLNSASVNIYLVDDVEGFGKTFDGIGAISGGGATSKLLINYVPPQRDEILDYLFKPNFGAALQILKVEIGGDAQSTDGTESSHMHNEDEINFERGYEWFLMKEAKKRNPKIKLGALAWAFPGWVGEVPRRPYTNYTKLAYYLTTWLKGAKSRYDLDIDHIGGYTYLKLMSSLSGRVAKTAGFCLVDRPLVQIWNEQHCDIEFVKYFRRYLNEHNFTKIKIVAPDAWDMQWKVTKDMQKDEEFHNAVDVIGEHYPGTYSTNDAVNTGKVLWSSEDYSTYNDRKGAGCWARILNQNYVNGFMSATLSWNLIYSYYPGLPYGGCGLMTAVQPWSGHYYINLPIWITAHTTHFAEPGWLYLKHNRGVSLLAGGGSFVSFSPPDKSQLSIVIETLTYENSQCIRPELKPYTVQEVQTAQFMLGGTFKSIRKLYLWRTDLSPRTDESQRLIFKPLEVVEVHGGIVSLNLQADNLYTLTTIEERIPMLHPEPPIPSDFPVPYLDDFEDYIEFSEPYNLSPQVGVFEARKIGTNGVAAQVVQQTPIHWCMANKLAMPHPTAVIGDYRWTNVEVTVDVLWPSYAAPPGLGVGFLAPKELVPIFLAARVNKGGCDTVHAAGVYFWIYPTSQRYKVTRDLAANKVIAKGSLGYFNPLVWNKIKLIVQDSHAVGYVNDTLQFSQNFTTSRNTNGFVAIGTKAYAPAFFDNLYIAKADTQTTKSTYSYLSAALNSFKK